MKRRPIICIVFVVMSLLPMAILSIGAGIHASVSGMSASSSTGSRSSEGDGLLFVNLLVLYFALGAIASLSTDRGLRRAMFVVANIAVAIGCIVGASDWNEFLQMLRMVTALIIVPTLLWIVIVREKKPNQALQTTPMPRSEV